MKIQEFFRGLVEHKKAQGFTSKTAQEYNRIIDKILLPSIGQIELENLREIDADKIKIQGRNHGVFGPERGIVVFRQLLQYIKKVGYKLEHVEWRDIKVPPAPKKEVDWLNDDEWEQVRNAFDLKWIVGLRDRALCEILRVSGLRISEALSLNRDSINWDEKEVKIRNCKPPHEVEKVYFTDEALYWVKQYLQIRNENCEPLFVSTTGQRATPCGVRRTIHAAMKRAGITKRIHPHIFRSSFGTTLLENGTDIKAVQTLMRHRSERTTLKHYIAVNKSRAKGEHQRVLNKPMPKLEIDLVKELMWKSTVSPDNTG